MIWQCHQTLYSSYTWANGVATRLQMDKRNDITDADRGDYNIGYQ